ncbi:MAG: ComF family protein [Clostridia bacterium]|nr:ComF family protein [Clostridia bacterium]
MLSALRALLFPPRCLCCGKRIDRTHALCETCALQLERDMRTQCPDCFLEYASCHCAPACVRRAGVSALLKLAPYREDGAHSAARRIILRMKTRPNARAFSFLALELAAILRPFLAERNESDASVTQAVIAWLPRSRRNLRRYGFDQAKELARVLGRETGLPVVSLLKRLRDTRPQKELTARERRENVRGCFALAEDVRGMRVILVDDVITTGEGMAEAARMLRRGKAADVVLVSVAVTPRRSRK